MATLEERVEALERERAGALKLAKDVREQGREIRELRREVRTLSADMAASFDKVAAAMDQMEAMTEARRATMEDTILAAFGQLVTLMDQRLPKP